MVIGDFIKLKRTEKKMTLKDLAQLCSTTDATLSRIETGKNEPDFTLLISLSKNLNFTLNELASATGFSTSPSETPPSPPIEQIIEKTVEKTNKRIDLLTEMLKKVYEDDLKEELPHIEGSLPVHYTNNVIKYPIMSDQSACGLSLIPAEDEVEDWISLPEDYAVNAEIVLRAKGDCLENEKIHDGYLVFIKCQNIASTGDIVAVRVIENSHGHAILKKLRIIKGDMFLTDKSGDIIEFKENMSIVGKAVYWMPDPRKFG